MDRYFYKIEKIDEDGNIVGKILETLSCVQDSDDDSDVMSDEEEVVNIKDIKGKIIGDSLQVEYPLHSRGVMQCYTRISKDASFVHYEIKFDENGDAV